jgi:uncharacterized protein YebE (UPF0316 family)
MPVMIFVAEVCVVTLSTVRIIFVARGRKLLSAVLGFFEVGTWLFAIGQVMSNLNDPACYLAFAGGFALGNYLGVTAENRLALGTLVVRVITPRDAAVLAGGLRSAGYGVTSLEGRGAAGPVEVVMTIIPRKDLGNVTALIRGFDPEAFYSVDDVQTVARGVFPLTGAAPRGLMPPLLGASRPFV